MNCRGDTLPSLLVRELYVPHSADEPSSGEAAESDVPPPQNWEQVQKRCSQALIDIMPSDAASRARLSTYFEKDKENLEKLIDQYYQDTFHSGVFVRLSSP